MFFKVALISSIFWYFCMSELLALFERETEVDSLELLDLLIVGIIELDVELDLFSCFFILLLFLRFSGLADPEEFPPFEEDDLSVVVLVVTENAESVDICLFTQF